MTYTNLKLSRFLAEKGFDKPSEGRYDDDGYFILGEWGETIEVGDIPAYDILNDLCVKYAKELFGEESFSVFVNDDDYMMPVFPWSYHPEQILSLLQQNQDPTDYIIKNCVL